MVTILNGKQGGHKVGDGALSYKDMHTHTHKNILHNE